MIHSSSNFIIVERDLNIKDCGVFTGQVQIVSTRLRYYDEERKRAWQSMDGISSPHIEHAFVFFSAHTAWRFAASFEPHWCEAAGRYWGFRRWVVRQDDRFFPGEAIHDNVAIPPNNYFSSWIPQEAMLAQFTAGYTAGRDSVLREQALNRGYNDPAVAAATGLDTGVASP